MALVFFRATVLRKLDDKKKDCAQQEQMDHAGLMQQELCD